MCANNKEQPSPPTAGPGQWTWPIDIQDPRSGQRALSFHKARLDRLGLGRPWGKVRRGTRGWRGPGAVEEEGHVKVKAPGGIIWREEARESSQFRARSCLTALKLELMRN
ncbi:hypothetical protein KM043_003623 [Ampulex compressa]|nr:hypothetical protein KM043_003623 [Ampulex compressa]